ncbi:uncharacterized protein [Dendropsophus ebraccatus]|uniref:uncharacterized protein n=1 Tax=Dendropsophus ebraccatus TaxID=150705 RepID=UPI0038320950
MADTMCQKLNQIREIMETKDIKKGEKPSQPQSGHSVAIISALEESNVQWLLRVISSRHFQEQVRNLKFIDLEKIKGKPWEKLSADYTFCIYVSSEDEWTQGKLSFQRVKVLSLQGKKKTIVVMDDVKSDTTERKSRILKVYPDMGKYVEGLFLFSRMEKESDYERCLYNPLKPGPDNPHQGFQVALAQKVMIGIRHKVGIFSRSSDRDYSWLIGLLASEPFRDHVLAVRPCLITNNGYKQFHEDLSNCTFGILYHTKNNGRVNITDVAESLYDEEIQDLSKGLGKENFIVVIDDLEDTRDEVKHLILNAQPKIEKYAKDLILMSYEDKTESLGQSAKTKILKVFLKLPDDKKPPAKYENYREDVSYPSMERSRSPSYRTPSETTTSSLTHAAAAPSRNTIGIFSRSEEDDYSWLRRLLTPQDSGHKEVLCCKISGNDKVLQDAAFKSKFGILYHSMKNGKLRLTDVTNSLYHEELEKLSAKLGKKRMMVVIDDLDDSGDKMKQKILIKQPSLRRLVADIFLFTAAEKKQIDQQSQGKPPSKMSKSTSDKVSGIKTLLT